jgi:hypothetical protein
MADSWLVRLEKQDANGAVICGPFCINLPCTDGGGDVKGCVACTTLLCATLGPFTLPVGTSTQTVAFAGVKVGDTIFLSAPSLPAGVTITSAVSTGADVMVITFDNTAGSPQTVPSQMFSAVVTRVC